jgi:tetratricopeptide (TPR) repeat protein
MVLIGVAFALLLVVSACAPQRPYRMPQQPSGREPAGARPAPTVPPLAAPAAPEALKPLPQESKIREQDLKSKLPPAAPTRKDQERVPSIEESRPAPESTAPAPLPDDSSLLAKITPGISPQRAASLRLTDEGSKLIDAGEPARALNRLEKTIVIDATNPYGYFYLAKAQARLGRYREALNFLTVAERRLNGEPFWLAEVYALRGDIYREQGQLQQAQASYHEALRVNSGNRVAAEGLSRLPVETPRAGR